MTQKKTDELTARIRQLESDLADVDQLVSAQAYLIDSNPPHKWPANSILRRSMDRHAARVAKRSEAETERERERTLNLAGQIID